MNVGILVVDDGLDAADLLRQWFRRETGNSPHDHDRYLRRPGSSSGPGQRSPLGQTSSFVAVASNRLYVLID
jgi:hypothetical protein